MSWVIAYLLSVMINKARAVHSYISIASYTQKEQ